MVIYADDHLIYTPTFDPYDLHGGVVHLEHNSIGKFEFKTIKQLDIQPLKSIIKVMRNNDEDIFYGRIIDYDKKLYWIDYVAEGVMGFLNDTYLKITNETMAAQSLFNDVISNHNARSNFYFKASVSGLSGTVNLTKGYTKSYDLLKKITDVTGGFFYCQGNEIMHSIQPLRENNQPIELGKNLLDEHIKGNYVDIKTIVICGNEKREVVVQNDDAVAKYGKIYDVFSPTGDDLAAEANERLAVVSSSLRTLELSAVDLSLIDVNYDSFKLYDNVRIINKLHRIDTNMMVKQLNLNILNPADNTISFGKRVDLISDKKNDIATVGEVNDAVTRVDNINSKVDDKAPRFITGTNGKKYELIITEKDGKPNFELKEVKD